MAQEDYLKKQIDQLARALAKMLYKLLNLPTTASVDLEIEDVSQVLKKEIDLDLPALLMIPKEDFIRQLRNERKMTDQHLETLAEIFTHLTQQEFQDQVLKRKLMERTLLIWENLNETSTTYSLDRQFKCDAIRKRLDDL